MSLLVDFSIFPVGKGESVSPYVARAAKVIRESGLPHRFGSMGTEIEGEWEEIAPVISQCLKEMGKDCNRLYFSLKGDYRQGKTGRMEGKLKSLEGKL